MLSNIEKVSKVFNYMARIFSSTSAMLNNFITIYNTVKQLNEFISTIFNALVRSGARPVHIG